MRKIFATIVYFLVLALAGAAPVLALTFDEFQVKSQELVEEKIKPDEFLKLCNDVFSKDTGDDKNYLAYVYAMRSHAYWQKGDIKRAEADAKKSIEIAPEESLGHLVLLDAFTSGEKYEDAAKVLDHLIAGEKDRKQKAEFQQKAADLRLRANIMSPATLWNAFDGNEVAANKAYKGKIVPLKGKIAKFSSSIMGNPEIVFFIDGHGFNKVMCQFPKSAEEDISKMKKGQTVQLAGQCSGMIIKSVILKDCYFF